MAEKSSDQGNQNVKSVPPSKTTQMEQGVEDAIHEKEAEKLRDKSPKVTVVPIGGQKKKD